MRIKKNDLVLITKGKDRGKQGTVQQTINSKRKVVVEGVGMVKRHMKAQGMRAAEIIEKEMSVLLILLRFFTMAKQACLLTAPNFFKALSEILRILVFDLFE